MDTTRRGSETVSFGRQVKVVKSKKAEVINDITGKLSRLNLEELKIVQGTVSVLLSVKFELHN